MAKLGKKTFLVALFTILMNISSAEEAKSITDDCKKRCERIYPPHTYPKQDTHSACLRGCRLSAIGQLSSSERTKMNATKSCAAGCVEGYSDKDTQYACKVGCNEQAVIPTAETLYKEHKQAEGMWSISGYVKIEPLMIARQYCHGLMRKITYYAKTSTAFYTSTQNGKTVIVQVNSPPEFFASVSAAVKESEDSFTAHLEKQDDGNGHHHYHHFAWKAVEKSKAWLHCVSRRSGLPFWLLSTLLFTGFAFLLWLCCSSIASPNREEKEKRLLVDDIYLLEGDELYKKHLTTEEEAEPLPMKIKITATTI